MTIIALLIIVPLIVALALLLIKSNQVRVPLVLFASIAIAALSVVLAIANHGAETQALWQTDGNVTLFGKLSFGAEAAAGGISYIMLVIEVALAAIIIYLGIKYKKYLASILSAAQATLLVWFELTQVHEIEAAATEPGNYIYIDNFSLIMVVIIGIIGSGICVYALGYMKDFQHHAAEEEGAEDRRPWFFFLLFLFLAAMVGIVVSNNLIWMYFFWEITTLCSFFLIGFTKTEEATNNAFRAIIFNLLGGLAFAVAIVLTGSLFKSFDLSHLLEVGSQAKTDAIVSTIAGLLAFAGITKAAQMPFNSWLLGAMVAPTPVSALLHSSTMVKAGVFLLIKISPLLGVEGLFAVGEGYSAGFMVIVIGSVTFLFASIAALSQSNAKRILAYSTIANLGLITVCAGVGTPAAVWCAILLVIFHAVTKSLLFLCVGTAEHQIGSRDVEDMDGLFGRTPRLALFMVIGISAMFLAPFGMLVSKWAALQTFIENNAIWALLAVVFGSAVTLFYWAKWLGKLSANIANTVSIEHNINRFEWSITGMLTALTLVAAITFPFFSSGFVVPYLSTAFASTAGSLEALASDNMMLMAIMTILIAILALLFYGHTSKRIVPLYMAGASEGDDLTYKGAMGKDQPVALRNWYFEELFPEKKINLIGIVVTCAVLAICFAFMGGGITVAHEYIKAAAGGVS